MSESPLPPTPPSPFKSDFQRVIRRLDEHDLFAQRLMVIGSGPPVIRDAEWGALALDSDGAAVLLLAIPLLTSEQPARIADQLDRIAQMGEPDLTDAAESAITPEQLREKHRWFFNGEASVTPRLNRDQAAVVVVRDDPTADAWKALLIELGPQLRGIYKLVDGVVSELTPPAQLLRSRAGAGVGDLTLGVWISFLAILSGIGIIVYVIAKPEPLPPPPVANTPTLHSAIRDVAAGVLPDATNNQWIGQRRIVVTSDDELIAVVPTTGGVQVVSDQRNLGRAWRSAITFPELSATSFAVAIDASDNLHIAYGDGSEVSYVVLEASPRGFVAGEPLVLDDAATSPVIDIGWDRAQEVAHVVWAGESRKGQRPRWAQVSLVDGDRQVVDSGPLAPPGDTLPVLANIAVGDESQILVTYRRGDLGSGWFSRLRSPDETGVAAWGPEERLPAAEGMGAGSVAFDDRGVAHLVLRDSSTHRLLYFKRVEGGDWTSGQTAVDAEASEHIDFPIISVDTTSRLVYVFFQTTQFNPANEVVVAIRDPAGGWEGPYPVASAGPEGARYPNSMSRVEGQPIVLWTTGGTASVVRAARVTAP